MLRFVIMPLNRYMNGFINVRTIDNQFSLNSFIINHYEIFYFLYVKPKCKFTLNNMNLLVTCNDVILNRYSGKIGSFGIILFMKIILILIKSSERLL
jgi:hypothetical protein